ncbi:MAG: hypothetical protein WCE90_05345 [Candidatus Zixiibacteriota bacterium]
MDPIHEPVGLGYRLPELGDLGEMGDVGVADFHFFQRQNVHFETEDCRPRGMYHPVHARGW